MEYSVVFQIGLEWRKRIMNRRKKSGFLTFCFSLIPGAGEMYLGFMKMGVSLMGLFFAVIVVGVFLNVASVMLIDVIVWF